jgi:hypothetical protein
MTSFPNRPDLAALGPDAVDVYPVRDPSRALSAARFNLMKFQLAGLGVVTPLAFLSFSADTSPAVISRAEAWNPSGLTASPFNDPSLTKQATGNYDVEYTTPVTDKDGNSVALSFSWGFGVVVTPSLAVRKSVMVTPLSGTANGVKVCVFDASDALEDGNDVAIWIG